MTQDARSPDSDPCDTKRKYLNARSSLLREWATAFLAWLRERLRAWLPYPTERKVSPPPPAASTLSVFGQNPAPLLEELAALYDQLDLELARITAGERETTSYLMSRLEEIFVRQGVEVIRGEREFDCVRHQPERGGPIGTARHSILETLSPGFELGGRVLRRARVRLVLAEQSSLEG